jgi:hypothetical protein
VRTCLFLEAVQKQTLAELVVAKKEAAVKVQLDRYKRLAQFQRVCFGRVFELRFGILTRFEGMYVCFCFQWGIQAWASKCFVCIFLFGALFVNRSAQKLKHMHVLSCSSFSVLLCGTVLHLKVEQVRIFFCRVLCFWVCSEICENRQYLPARNNWHMVLKMKVSLRLAKW